MESRRYTIGKIIGEPGHCASTFEFDFSSSSQYSAINVRQGGFLSMGIDDIIITTPYKEQEPKATTSSNR
jgi:hypothetical protein